MMKDFELVFFTNNNTTETSWYNSAIEAQDHASLFTDSDNAELYDHLEIRQWIGNGYVTLWTGKPWEN